jgi:Spy/CpxP family protein refolding chaperone
VFKFKSPWVRRLLIGVFGASVLFGGLAACSHRGEHRAGWSAMSEEDAARFKAKMVDRVASRLDLDDAQKAKLGIVADKLREQRLAFVPPGKDPRAEVQALIGGATFDRAGAKAWLDAKTAAVSTKSPEVIAAFGDFYDSLKPEQQQKLREAMSKWGGRHGGRG